MNNDSNDGVLVDTNINNKLSVFQTILSVIFSALVGYYILFNLIYRSGVSVIFFPPLIFIFIAIFAIVVVWCFRIIRKTVPKFPRIFQYIFFGFVVLNILYVGMVLYKDTNGIQISSNKIVGAKLVANSHYIAGDKLSYSVQFDNNHLLFNKISIPVTLQKPDGTLLHDTLIPDISLYRPECHLFLLTQFCSIKEVPGVFTYKDYPEVFDQEGTYILSAELNDTVKMTINVTDDKKVVKLFNLNNFIKKNISDYTGGGYYSKQTFGIPQSIENYGPDFVYDSKEKQLEVTVFWKNKDFLNRKNYPFSPFFTCSKDIKTVPDCNSINTSMKIVDVDGEKVYVDDFERHTYNEAYYRTVYWPTKDGVIIVYKGELPNGDSKVSYINDKNVLIDPIFKEYLKEFPSILQ